MIKFRRRKPVKIDKNQEFMDKNTKIDFGDIVSLYSFNLVKRVRNYLEDNRSKSVVGLG